MSEPVKTTLMKALETALAALPGIPTVRREFDLPFDLDEENPETGEELFPKPALVFWESPEDPEDENLLTRVTLELSLAVFIKLTDVIGDGQTPTFQEFSDAAEILANPIKSLLADRGNLQAWGALGLLGLEPIGISKALASEFYGEMVLTYRFVFWHRKGDATSLILQ